MKDITFEEAIDNIKNIPVELEPLSLFDVKSLLFDWYIEGKESNCLSQEYGIVDRFYLLFSKVNFPSGWNCSRCDEELLGSFPSKTSLIYKLGKIEPSSKLSFNDVIGRCKNCGHIEESSCTCMYCVAERNRLLDEKYIAVKNIEPSIPTFELDDLCIGDYIDMISWLRTSWSSDMTYVESFDSRDVSIEDRIYNDFSKELEVIDRLWEQDFITVDSSSPISAFSYKRQDGVLQVKSFFIKSVNWKLRTAFESVSKHRFLYPNWGKYFRGECFHDNLMNPIVQQIAYDNVQDLYSLWKNAVLDEAIEYFKYKCKELGLDAGAGINPGEKTIAMFKNLLERWTLSDVFYFIWSASRDALAYKVSAGVSSAQAANSIKGKIERLSTRADQNNWTLKEFERIKDLPLSIAPYILYCEILQLPREGLHTVPNVEYIYNKFYPELL
ncbi:hypothetical protein OZX68_00205 [Streptococcaceae bacterium ESL0729]|nr:hypothetical protein OZX68_00205 [Streptococcaceae bacterium ESL0729]